MLIQPAYPQAGVRDEARDSIEDRGRNRILYNSCGSRRLKCYNYCCKFMTNLIRQKMNIEVPKKISSENKVRLASRMEFRMTYHIILLLLKIISRAKIQPYQLNVWYILKLNVENETHSTSRCSSQELKNLNG